MRKEIDIILTNPSLELIVRWMIGGLFVYACVHKIIEPSEFAKIIYGYDLFPIKLINIMAIVLPYIELFSGLFLLFGIWPRSSAVVINLLLIVFIIAISINLIRGHQFDCGCFSFKAKSHEASATQLLIRDIVLSCMAMVLVLFKGKRKFLLLE